MKCCAWILLVNVCNCVRSLFDIYCQSEDMTNFDILQGKLEPSVENVKLKWKSMKNAAKRVITDLNVPNCSRDIPFQSQEFGQDGHRHLAGFQPHFRINTTSQTQYCKTMTKWKCNISEVLCFSCLKLCRLLELGKGILLHFKFVAMAARIKNYFLLLKNKRSIV